MLAATAHQALEDVEYDAFALALRQRFANIVGAGRPIFTTSAAGLFEAYLRNLPAVDRQVHNCNTCRRFIEAYGGLVVIDTSGNVEPAMWDAAGIPPTYRAAVETMRELVLCSRVTGAFFSADKAWGVAKTGDWRHLHVVPPEGMVHKRRDLTAEQLMAEKREDHRILCQALDDFTEQHLEVAVTLLKSEALYRSEKVLGVAEYLLALSRARKAAKGYARIAGTWLAATTAPTGWCHVRTTMIGSLLEDIASGLPLEDVKRKFAAKMRPDLYQRPQAAPAAGNIAQAEKLVEKMGIALSLKRRMARLDDLVLEWRPRTSEQAAGAGVFAGIKSKQDASPAARETVAPNMTWSKFAATLLPVAERLQALAPVVGSYCGILTAADPSAPPILQWDREGRRNPLSTYTYTRPSSAHNWNVAAGWVDVIGIHLAPHMHSGGLPNHKPSAMALLRDARDLNLQGSCLFPEDLKAELHPVRSTIEAYSNSTPIQTDPEAVAGLPVIGITLRVYTGAVITRVTIDRWD
ncbi:hypothetical protein [Piscinibacter gummiphilus]|uniref:Uncharacterized protein n=1 Tax=Piscinibacter gummiphilus TaxID=946333 RepID=A0ABZ0CPQ0_9BURK|nr:hypothetical protein [Piscinibacter gummiphilus]WOB06501.1 hypothetical protein RXV79_16385 [Piscinibacter gummiphilus]